MTARELTIKTLNDIKKRRLKGEKEYMAYQKEKNSRKLKNWSVKVGGGRW